MAIYCKANILTNSSICLGLLLNLVNSLDKQVNAHQFSWFTSTLSPFMNPIPVYFHPYNAIAVVQFEIGSFLHIWGIKDYDGDVLNRKLPSDSDVN